MRWWQAGFSAVRGARRFSDQVAGNATGAIRSRQLQSLPRRVRRRGYLIPGDAVPPPGFDLPDYRGLDDSPRGTTGSECSVMLGRAIDLDSGMPAASVRLPLPQFFRHAAVIAPPGSGKTYGVIVPWAIRLLRAGASVVVLDVTGALHGQLRDYAREAPSSSAATVRTMHWTMHPRATSDSWNPLAGVSPHDLLAIEGLKSAIAGDEPPDLRHRDFHDRDLRILGALLRMTLASMPNPTLADVAEAMLSPASYQRLVRSASGRAPDWDELNECWSLRNKLEPFGEPNVRSRTTRNDVDISTIGSDHTLAVVGAELELKSVAQAASAMFVNRLVGLLQARFSHGPVRPVILVVDEAPEIARRIDLAGILATARATRTGVVLACQNATQFGDDAEQSTIFDACDLLAILPGASEASIRRFQARLGQREVDRVSMGSDIDHPRRVSRVERSSERLAMIGDRELLQPPFGRHPAIVHSREIGSRPFALELDRSWATE